MSDFNFVTIVTGDPKLERIQANVQNAFNGFSSPFVGGNLLTGVAVGSSATAINHKLGRQPQLWVICDQDTTTTVKRISWNATTITLQAAAPCKISIWVN